MAGAEVIGSDTPCMSIAVSGDTLRVDRSGARRRSALQPRRAWLYGFIAATLNSTRFRVQSIPSFFSLYRNARNVIPNCAAVLVLFQRFSSSAFWIAVRSICSI